MNSVRLRPITLAGIAIGAVALDAATKAIALRLPADGVALLPVLDLSLGFNRGVSFGLFDGSLNAHWIAIATGIALAALVVIGALNANGIERVGYALIFGGGIANLVDRLADGQVTDFIDIHAGGWHFPTFNIADVAITCGAIIATLSLLRVRIPRHQSQSL